MALRSFNPTSPARRFMTVSTFEELSKVAPEKSLLEPLKKHSGRNSYGRITVRHRGGGVKRQFRMIDFKREKDGIPAKVVSIEYDPNRSAHIALLEYEDKERRYILAPDGRIVGDTVISGPDADMKPGNALPLANIPVGTMIHNVELYPGKGAQLVYVVADAVLVLEVCGDELALVVRGVERGLVQFGAEESCVGLQRCHPQPSTLVEEHLHCGGHVGDGVVVERLPCAVVFQHSDALYEFFIGVIVLGIGHP